ncbi:MAG: methylaspartate mutase subunit E [Dictyoglomus sp.]|nr:methylaspartate mutase subunit E [Dictyoglomus sp.]MCX7942683.1 methylaspartate mutase subunit E [Dictyoglomaceae bacterium]MDW8188154.1 methylaspartate mutase subunit E [Dictyoglomus sp.]
MVLKNKKWDEKYFFRMREEVLNTWHTGKEVDLKSGIEYHKSLPLEKQFDYVLRNGEKENKILLQPRAGVPILKEHIELLKYLQDNEADLLPTTIDSYTRQNRYREAQLGLDESLKEGRSLLNGFPAVNYGVRGCREIIENVKIPVEVRHGSPDARLLAEITLCSGFTSFEGGGITYNIPYAKDVPLENSLIYWQYVDYLVGYYAENGVIINRESFGPLTGTLVPPCISISIGIIEALLAVEQGVKSFSVGYGEGGNIVQDVAAIKVMKRLTEKYLKDFGYYDVHITTVLHHWMGGFPEDEARAFAVITYGTIAGFLGSVSKIIVKTPQEAIGIPTKEANAQALRNTRQTLQMLENQYFLDQKLVEEEEKIIEEEVKSILDKVYTLGEGDFLIGTVRAFSSGVLDVPFAPSRFAHGRVMPIRDNNGAIRFFDFGNLPIPTEIKDFHKEKIEERSKFEGRPVSFQMVLDDIYAISKGRLIGRFKKGT